MNRAKSATQIHAFAQRNAIQDILQYFDRGCLRFAERHDAADVIRRILGESVTHQSPPPHRHTQADERYSGYNLSYRIHSAPTAFAESF